jgi:hypothetical protein
MSRNEVIDEIIKNNTLNRGYSGFDEILSWNSNHLNVLENIDNPHIPGVTFKYTFYIDLYTDDYKENLESLIKNIVINTPQKLNDNISNTIVYHTSNLPVFSFDQKNDREWEITYKINYSSMFYSTNTCKDDPSNCEEIFSAHALDNNNSLKIEQVTHHDVYHLLQTVSKYPPSNKFLNEYKKITVKSNNQNNAFQLFQDYCYFMKKKLGIEERYENNSKVTNFNNFCAFDFDGSNPDILIHAINYSGETVNFNGMNKEIDPSLSQLNYQKYKNYQKVSEFQSLPLQSYPESKFIYLNYCRGSNFNNPECQQFYRAMFKKASQDGGNLDEDVQQHLLLMCHTKDKYVPDNINYYNKIYGDYDGNTIEKKDITKEECQIECDKLEHCKGFVMDIPVVELFADVNFTQSLGILSEGKYDTFELEANGIPNDSVVAIRIPENYLAICYNHGNFDGEFVVLTGDNILADHNMNDKLSSIHIVQFNCTAYKEKNPDLVAIYGTNCNILMNHYKQYGLAEKRDASGYFQGKGCWLKRKMTQLLQKNDKVSFQKQDTDNVCSCFYQKKYYDDYLKKNNFPIEASREKPKCWFPKCFGGIDAIKAEPNTQCSDLIICNNEIQNILKAGGDMKNVNINIQQFSQCSKTNKNSDTENVTDNTNNNNTNNNNTDNNTENSATITKENSNYMIIFLFTLLFILIGGIIGLLIVLLRKKKSDTQPSLNTSLKKQISSNNKFSPTTSPTVQTTSSVQVRQQVHTVPTTI